jgi:ribose/xylose/arabinose/galactoside ABC-type transport system permease subunit
MNKFVRRLLPCASLGLLVVILAIWQPETFLSGGNMLNILRRTPLLGIAAVGMTLIIISGGIDLSVGSMLALCGMVGARVMLGLGGENPTGMCLAWGTAAGVLAGGLCGLANGLVITRFNLPPFIVTLGSMSLFRGVALVMNDGQPYNVNTYTALDTAVFLGLPVSAWLFLVVALAGGFLLGYTRPGRYAYAIGSNEEAAFHAGIGVRKYKVFIYAFAGILAGLAAMIGVSRTISAQPTAGTGMELDVIAAVVIGGASLSGGRGSVLGTVVGTFLIFFLRNGCNLIGITTNAQHIVIGVVIVAAVAVDQLARHKARG